MGRIEEKEDAVVYRQEDGRITARFTSLEEKRVLTHEGSPRYRRVFNWLVLTGGLYLAYIFFAR